MEFFTKNELVDNMEIIRNNKSSIGLKNFCSNFLKIFQKIVR